MITRWESTCLYTSSRYRQGDCLRERGPLFSWPHFVSLHLGPGPAVSPSSSSSSSSSPVRMRHKVHRGGGSMRQEAGERRGHQFLHVLHAHLSNIDVHSRSFEQNCPTTAHAQADRAITNWEEGSTRSGTLAGRRASSVSQSDSQSINPSIRFWVALLLQRQPPHQ